MQNFTHLASKLWEEFEVSDTLRQIFRASFTIYVLSPGKLPLQIRMVLHIEKIPILQRAYKRKRMKIRRGTRLKMTSSLARSF